MNRQPAGGSNGGQFAPQRRASNDEVSLDSPDVLDSLNPTGTVTTNYDPTVRATAPLADNMTTLDQTLGLDPEELVRIYRGVPADASDETQAGDYVTTNAQLAKDYAGTGKVISAEVRACDILDDMDEPGGEEYIYRPAQ